MKKKPVLTRMHHHLPSEEEEVSKAREHWVTSVAAYPNTDLLASGNWKLN